MKINKEEFKQLVERNNFRLLARTYGAVDRNGIPTCGCVFTHLYCENQPVPIDDDGRIDVDVILAWARNKYTPMFTSGLIAGFDWANKSKESLNFESEEYREGYANGLELRDLAFNNKPF